MLYNDLIVYRGYLVELSPLRKALVNNLFRATVKASKTLYINAIFNLRQHKMVIMPVFLYRLNISDGDQCNRE